MHDWDRIEISVRAIGNGYVGNARIYSDDGMVVTDEMFGSDLAAMKLLAEQAIDMADDEFRTGKKEGAF